MQLECFVLGDAAPDIVPGRPQRGWMDAFADRHPYRCLPLTMANSTGWEILCPIGFTAEWNGGPHDRDITVDARRPAIAAFSDFAKSHFSPRGADLPPRLPLPHAARLVDLGAWARPTTSRTASSPWSASSRPTGCPSPSP